MKTILPDFYDLFSTYISSKAIKRNLKYIKNWKKNLIQESLILQFFKMPIHYKLNIYK